MSTLYTPTWGNSNSPRMYIDWSYSSSATSVTYNWTAYYTAAYAAYTNGNARSWSVTIGGTTKSGSYNINGVTGTVKLGSGSVTVERTHASQTVGISISMDMNVTWDGTYGGTKSNSMTDTMSALASYAVKFNANGGSGAPSSQTKWYGETLTLSSTKPTREGYAFQGWATSSTAASAAYSAGGSYTANSAATLYAVWKVNAPAAPTSCTNVRNSDTKNTVSWTRGADASETYAAVRVERSVDDGEWSQIASLEGSVTSYTDSTCSADHSYRYRVRAYNSTGFSDYATSGYSYNTPSAPGFKSIERTADTDIKATLTNAARTATALEIQRSADKSEWEAVGSMPATTTSFEDSPGGGTFYYRARNTRGSLASAWAYSEAVVTICAPAAPTLKQPASSAVVSKAQGEVRFEWAHNPIDGSSQTAAELAYSTDGGKSWVTLALTTAQSKDVDNGFAVNSTVTWRVRTKGAHSDFSPWSSNRVFYVRQVPTVSFERPGSGCTVTNTPIEVSLAYFDPSGDLAGVSLSVTKDGEKVWEKDIGAALEYEITSDEFLPDNGAEYVLSASVRSTSTLQGSATRAVEVSFVEPCPACLRISTDPDTGYVSLQAFLEEDASLAAAESISVFRVSRNGRVPVSEGMANGDSVIDKYAPLNVDFRYDAVTFADSGAYSTREFKGRVTTPWAFFYYQTDGDEAIARAMLDPADTIDLKRPGRLLQRFAGRPYPVKYDGAAFSVERRQSWLLTDDDEAAAFYDLMAAGGTAVYKSHRGDVFWADVSVSLSPSLSPKMRYGHVTAEITRIDGEVL